LQPNKRLSEFLREEGIDARVDSKVVGVERQGNSIGVKVESAGKISQVAGTHVLVAIGRRPNTDNLVLDTAGIATDAHGYIQVDDQLRTNVTGIWAMGDCYGRGAFTHISWNDFEIVAANLLDNEQRRVSDRITAYALYTDPPLGRAGMTKAEVRKTGKRALIATLAMEDVSRAYETLASSTMTSLSLSEITLGLCHIWRKQDLMVRKFAYGHVAPQAAQAVEPTGPTCVHEAVSRRPHAAPRLTADSPRGMNRFFLPRRAKPSATRLGARRGRCHADRQH
jgi:pyruvate/2-oxoglutarate dehydrogenase complex dihydrolipoamide dehydrogenase (E3) component